MASSETPPPSLRQGVRIAPHDSSVSVEEALLAAGEEVGHGNLVFASRVNKAVLVFVKSEQMVHQLVASGVIIRDLYVQVSPLSVPSTRVTVSGVPPFIPNELLEVELRRFGKFASGFKTKKRLELSSFLQERVKGALVRCRFLEIKEMDAPTPFFFNLERSVAQRKQMSCLKLPGGRVTSSPEEMRDHAMDFYTNLFGGQQCSTEGREETLEGLPQLSPEEKAALDLELTLEELTGALLKNWRPVALLTVDYKGVGSVALLPVLRGLLRARLRVEYTYYHLMDNIQAFSHMWAVGGCFVLCGGGW
ncbi:hypothetical protein NHX12_015394 [Muraenolepis orangiensis]|uniref:Uncharacterized protein n=1 Tax=Muraenolepis orangiensis TaxID=630683 RepID=A0A9Q0D916_9TELE|nr:hypothetical protein NHX12_015394 [Muraenolepis orangiensis]